MASSKNKKMINTTKPLVSICIPHWQLKELITICLRAIRKNTLDIPIEVIVVDNGSQDDSLDYLRRLSWIKLIERGSNTPQAYTQAVLTAYDVGFANSRGDYFLVMHLDTIVKSPDWLQTLLDALGDNPKCALAGAWKLEKPQPLRDFIKKITDTKKAKLWLRRTLLRDPSARRKKREICPRDYCALYRAEPIRRLGLKFAADGPWKGYTAGEQMYYQLKQHGYHPAILEVAEMLQHVTHINHATAGLRPGQRQLRHRRSRRKVARKLRRFFNSSYIKELTQNNTLDK